MDSYIPVGRFNIKLGHQGPWTVSSNHAYYLVQSDVLEGELLRVDAIINARPLGGREVDNQAPLPGLTPKLLICKLGSGGEEKGPATLPSMTSLAR